MWEHSVQINLEEQEANIEQTGDFWSCLQKE